MVDGIIEEKDLGRFNEDGSQGQKAGLDEPINQSSSSIAECPDDGTDHNIGNQNEDDSQDASREVIDQHLKTDGDFFFPEAVKFHD